MGEEASNCREVQLERGAVLVQNVYGGDEIYLGLATDSTSFPVTNLGMTLEQAREVVKALHAG